VMWKRYPFFITLFTLIICLLLPPLKPYSNEEPTLLRLVQQDVFIGGRQYLMKSILGQGPNWKTIDNVDCLVIENYTQPFHVIYQNELEEPVIIHAHGLTPPSFLDGAPYISSLPLAPGRQQLVSYTLQEHNTGTNFLHSHYAFQLGEGMAAPLIVKGVADKSYPLYNELETAQESVMFLQDVCPFFPENKMQTTKKRYSQQLLKYKRLKYGIGRCNQQAIYERFKAEFENATKPFPECPRVKPATTHELYYEAILANGKTLEDPIKVHVDPGTYVKIRIINACGMTSFKVQIPPLLVQRSYIVAVDGQLIHPLRLDSFWLTNAQRVDLLVHMPEKDQIVNDTVFPILAISEGLEPSMQTGIILYSQDIYPKNVVNPPIISKKIVGFMDSTEELQMRAWKPLTKKPVDKTFDIKLTGDNGFESINGHSYQMFPEAPYAPNPYPLRVRDGDRVQINFLNNNQDGHPMHLHGHSFQVIAIDGKPIEGALRDTVIIQGGCHSVSVIFDANNPGIWPLHCHMEFHLAAGMMTTVEYYNHTAKTHTGW
jgi:FtsP/CotA-like multicopper oxidase with cupredoxin domain